MTDRPVRGESRLPMAAAVLVLMGLTLVSPAHLSFFPGWLLAAIEGILLLILMIGDPGRIDRETPWLHWTSVLLVAVLLASALGSTVLLILDLLDDSPVTAEAGPLLLAGAKVWLTNNIAFALLYWEFDDGGPVKRAIGLPDHPDLAFPQQTQPRARQARLAAGVHRLPVRRLHDGQRVQPDRHHADGPLGEGRDGVAGADLVHDRRARHRPRGQFVRVVTPGDRSSRRGSSPSR